MDTKVLEGNPLETPVQDPAIEIAKQEEARSEEQSSEPLYKGMTGHISNVDELKVYAQNLEQMLVAQKASGQNAPAAYQPTFTQPIQSAPTNQEPQFEDLLYTDPKKAEEVLLKKVERQLNERRDAEQAKKKFWEDFYEKNVDLKNEDRLVQFYVKANWSSIENLPMDHAAQFIAKGTREVIGDVRKRHGVTEKELPNGRATTFGASGEPAPVMGSRAVAAPKSLTEQLSAMKAVRRRK